MKKVMSRILAALTIILLAAAQPVASEGRSRQEVTDSILGSLSIAANARDSIRPLYDLFDISYGPERKRLARQLYTTAKQAGNITVSLNMLRNLAFIGWRDDTTLSFIKKELEDLKDTPEMRSTNLYTDMMKIDNLILKDSVESNENHLLDYVRRYSAEVQADPYDRAVLLYAVCRYLGRETRGVMLETYIDSLHRLVESMNLPDGSVRRHIYTQSAPIFYENDNFQQVIETDKRLLHEIDSLEVSYAEEGRTYFNAVRMRYGSYRRLLGCYPVLSDDEIEEYYERILYLGDLNPDIAADIQDNEIARIFYAMATSDYPAAIRMIKRQLDNPSLSKIRLKMLRMLMEAATKIDDKATMNEASLLLNKEFEKHLKAKRNERSRELQLVYDLSDMLNKNTKLEEKSHLAAIRARTIVLIISSIAIVALAILAFMLFRQNRKNRRLAESLKRSNESLRTERDQLKDIEKELTVLRDQARLADRRKTEFVNNMSHEIKVPLSAISEYAQLITDCIPENQRAYLDRFAMIINQNVKMVMRLVNDVLDTDSIENGQISLEIRPTSVNSICRLAIDNVFECGRPDKDGLDFVFRAGGDDETTIETDGQRVSQVLVNLLTNAVKFSDYGRITLAYDNDPSSGKITFTVTDEGRGIPDGQEEAIFERFRRLDHTMPGCGLGLYIARLIADKLGGSVEVDTSYKGGARFIFTIPTKA